MMKATNCRTVVAGLVSAGICFGLVAGAPSVGLGQDEPGLPKEVFAHFDKMVGDWKVESTFLKMSLEGAVSFRLNC